MEMLSVKAHSFINSFIKFWQLYTDTNQAIKVWYASQQCLIYYTLSFWFISVLLNVVEGKFHTNFIVYKSWNII